MINQDDIVTVQISQQPVLRAFASSYMGTRDYQQDSYFYFETAKGALAVVCDGMGGMEHGERASQIAVKTLAEDFNDWTGGSIPDFFASEAKKIDKAVYELRDENGKKMDAGTTCVAVIVDGSQMYWMSVGDSRIYIIRGNEVLCVTRDHNYGYRLDRMLEKGEIDREQYDAEKKRAEALISFMGLNGLEMLDVNKIPFELEQGDRVLLCSDGLYKNLADGQLDELLISGYLDARETLNSLMMAVKDREKKHKDNTTAIMLAYE